MIMVSRRTITGVLGLLVISLVLMSWSCIAEKNVTLLPCGNSEYNPENQSCCQGQVFDGLRYSKCGDTCYQIGIESCINGKVGTLSDENSLPCGNTTYDPNTQSCCNKTVYNGLSYSRCGNTCYNLESQSCLNGKPVDGFGWGKCGDGFYDPSKQSCCQGKIYNGTTGYRTCGESCYNIKNETCCSGSIVDGKSDCVSSKN